MAKIERLIEASATGSFGEKEIRIGIYMRVSSRAGRDQDIERQKYGIEKHLEENPHKKPWHNTKGQYIDYASGGGWSRKELRRVIADFKRHYLDEIIFYEVDRLGRDARESFNYIDEVRKVGGAVYIVDGAKYAGPEFDGWQQIQLKCLFAEWELEKIISRTVSGNERKKAALEEQAKELGYEYLRTGSPGILEKWVPDPAGPKKHKVGFVVAPDKAQERKFREFWHAGVEIIDMQQEFRNQVSPTCEFLRINAKGKVVEKKTAKGKQTCKCNKPVSSKTISLNRKKLDLAKRHGAAWGHEKPSAADIFGIKFKNS